MLRIGTAGWTIPTQLKSNFEGIGTQLERYARNFNCVEINSSFHRDHRPETYAKWAACTPESFRFSVKLSRLFTHERKLTTPGEDLQRVLEGIATLDYKWAVLLIQLPPSLAFNRGTAQLFLRKLRKHYGGPVAWEPGHSTWSSPASVKLLEDHAISWVTADPETCAAPEVKSVSRLIYFRLHGSPAMYKSRNPPEYIQGVAKELGKHSKTEAWCIFDNTTFGFAAENAIELMRST